jgi:PAB1-binding protein PBP1
MRELEKHASRIAREIEGEDTKDIHLAEVSLDISVFGPTLESIQY